MEKAGGITEKMHVIIIEPADVDRYGVMSILFDMWRLRTKVFRDVLKWDVHVEMGLEIDQFDTSADGNPIYVVAMEGKYVIGSLRLLPTTGKTMLSEIFKDTIKGDPICDPDIWECSRVCYLPNSKLRQLQVSLKLIEGVREVASRYGIKTLVGNFDDKMAALYSRGGFTFKLMGKTGMFGPVVHLGKFDIAPGTLTHVERTLGRYIEQLKPYQQRLDECSKTSTSKSSAGAVLSSEPAPS